MSTGEVLSDLFVLAMLADNFLELGVLLGELLEAGGIADDLRGRELAGHLLETRVELIEFFGKGENGHGKPRF